VDLEARGTDSHYRKHQYDAIDVCDAWGLNPYEFCAIKYIQRRGQKDNNRPEDDARKAIWYMIYNQTRNKEATDFILRVYDSIIKEKNGTTNRDTGA
jgi:hypothetical protein